MNEKTILQTLILCIDCQPKISFSDVEIVVSIILEYHVSHGIEVAFPLHRFHYRFTSKNQ